MKVLISMAGCKVEDTIVELLLVHGVGTFSLHK